MIVYLCICVQKSSLEKKLNIVPNKTNLYQSAASADQSYTGFYENTGHESVTVRSEVLALVHVVPPLTLQTHIC